MKRKHAIALFVGAVAMLLTSAFYVDAQVAPEDEKARVSPRAGLYQRIGTTNVQVWYHRPSVRGPKDEDRQIWGGVVPYNEGQPFPWRAGANDTTIIEFSKDVKIEGQDLPAGKYGFHVIPSENEWILIFNKEAQGWGSFRYKAEEDALRVTITPEEAPHQEWLAYTAENLTENTADICLHWETKRGCFTVEAAAAE